MSKLKRKSVSIKETCHSSGISWSASSFPDIPAQVPLLPQPTTSYHHKMAGETT